MIEIAATYALGAFLTAIILGVLARHTLEDEGIVFVSLFWPLLWFCAAVYWIFQAPIRLGYAIREYLDHDA